MIQGGAAVGPQWGGPPRPPGGVTGRGQSEQGRVRLPRYILVGMAMVLLALTGCQTRLHGTELDNVPAQDFELASHQGRQVTLSEFRGRPVVLTFLYTSCPDICPLTAERLKLALNLLGGDAERVAVLAVSTDPEGDDLEAAQRFSRAHGLAERWHFLVGSRVELEPVWKAYYVAAVEQPGSPAHRVGHTDATFLIDKQGRLRSLLRADLDHAALAEDLRALLRE